MRPAIRVFCLAVVWWMLLAPRWNAMAAMQSSTALSVNRDAGSDVDSDSDGLSDRQELLFGANPAMRDTDGDGWSDGEEVWHGYSPTSTSRTPLAKRIHISLKRQTLAQSLGGVTFSSHLVSTGRAGMRTPTGAFAVTSKAPRAWSRRAGLWMPWWMAFTKNGRYGIHELPEWPGGRKEGAQSLGKVASGGCVRLGVGPAKTLYEWTPIGTQVIITE